MEVCDVRGKRSNRKLGASLGFERIKIFCSGDKFLLLATTVCQLVYAQNAAQAYLGEKCEIVQVYCKPASDTKSKRFRTSTVSSFIVTVIG